MTADEDQSTERLRQYFGASFDTLATFAEALRTQGEVRGLIGPREVDRIWERHILNSAALVPFLPTSGVIVDVGSGAGLPGLVIAAMVPDASVILIEPMERRCAWLTEMVELLELPHVDVRRGRAEEFHGAFEADAVTSRAVAPLDKLARWSVPLLRKGGELVVLKGRGVVDEIAPARGTWKKFGMTGPEILEAGTFDGAEKTTVVRSTRTTG